MLSEKQIPTSNERSLHPMKKVTPITKQTRTLGEISYRKGKLALKKFLDAESERQRQLYLNCEPYERQGGSGERLPPGA